MKVRSIRAVLNVLSGDHKSLMGALHWWSSPQGHHYWLDRYWGLKPLSEDDRGYLIRLANEARAGWRP